MFKLEFGPKAFIVVSDPVVARHLLKVPLEGAALLGLAAPVRRQAWLVERQPGWGLRRSALPVQDCYSPYGGLHPRLPAPAPAPLQENSFNYDKGVLAEILEPIMGKGLIPADLETWKVRRRVIVPGAARASVLLPERNLGRHAARAPRAGL